MITARRAVRLAAPVLVLGVLLVLSMVPTAARDSRIRDVTLHGAVPAFEELSDVSIVSVTFNQKTQEVSVSALVTCGEPPYEYVRLDGVSLEVTQTRGQQSSHGYAFDFDVECGEPFTITTGAFVHGEPQGEFRPGPARVDLNIALSTRTFLDATYQMDVILIPDSGR